ncbi:TPA: hypothetical protein PXM35_001306 [Yersinia enterocolitica]|nr:hypothetical protein [Yersinia enterocolitica]HDL7502550.1 hypothetical protein [Yersinia enterocolitica]
MAFIVLLGAGASHGSEHVDPHLPPLGNKLFHDLVECGGVAASLPKCLKDKFTLNFEDGMAEFCEYAHGDIMGFQRELARYLANFSPREGNIYIELIKALKSQRVIYSSLNYDLLFELSAISLGLECSYDSTFRKGYVRILKIHGSSNFWPDIPNVTIKNGKFSMSGRAEIQAPIRALNQIKTLTKCRLEDSLAPAIAIFAVGKAVRISPDFVENQYRLWKEQVKKALKVFIIGVRVHEVDEHIWGFLSSSKAQIHYFGFPSDREEFDRWQLKYPKLKAFFHKSDFKKSIQTIKRLSENK